MTVNLNKNTSGSKYQYNSMIQEASGRSEKGKD